MDLRGLGERIRAAREKQGLTQAALATRVGVTRSAVAQWETGRSGQVGTNLALIAEALGVGVSHLLLGDGSAPDGRTEFSGLTANERALVQLYRRSEAADQAVLLRLAHRLARRE